MHKTKNLPWLYAFLVGVLSVAPYIYGFFAIVSPSGNSLHFFYQDSELVYLARIREVLEGNFSIASPVFYEYKAIHSVQQPFGEWIYAILSLGNPDFLPTTALVSKFVFPAALFLFVFMISNRILNEYRVGTILTRPLSLGISTLIVLGYEFNNIMAFWSQFFSNEYTYPYLSLWTRLVNPITGALGLLFSLYLMLSDARSHYAFRVIAAGLILGMLSGYVFSFALGISIAFLLLCMAVILRDWSRVRELLSILAVACAINFVYFLTILLGNTSTSALAKTGLLETHSMMHNKVLYAAGVMLVLATIFAIRYRIDTLQSLVRNRSWQWSCAVLFASFVCFNQQVITGKTVWPGHFVQYTIPLSYIVFFTSGAWLIMSYAKLQRELWRKRVEKTLVLVSMSGVVLIMLVNVLTIGSVHALAEEYKDTQRYAPALEWLRTNGGNPCVVMVPEEKEVLEKFIPAYTQCDLYNSTYIFVAVPEERIIHNYIARLRLLGVTASTLSEYLDSHEPELREYFFEDWVDKFGDGRDAWLFSTKPESKRLSFIPGARSEVERAFKAYETESTLNLLTKYRIDYILIDTKNTTLTSEISEFSRVFKSGGVEIYSIPKLHDTTTKANQ